jgi:hypothetical protein
MRSKNFQLIALALLAAGATNLQWAAGTEAPLIKPPLTEDPRRAVIQKIVRSTYPDLFSSSAAPGWVAITLLMNQDGTLYKGYKDDTQPHPYITNKLKAFDAMGVDYERHGARVQLDMRGGPAGATRIYVRTYFLTPVSDPTRDVALVRAKVNERYRALYRPLSAERITEVTVFMTEAGDIERAKVDSVSATATEVGPTQEHFVTLGIPRERIGPMGKVMLFEGPYQDGWKSKRLLVIYAWPRRVGEPAPNPWQPEHEGPATPNDDPRLNRAIAERYFPDLYTYTAPKYEPVADFWVLLDREGRVLATGRRFIAARAELKLYLESLYPGIRTDGFQPTELKSDHGRSAVVNFMWLAADSPVTDLSTADLSKRADAALYASVSGEGSSAATTLVVLTFGIPAVAVDDIQNLDLQVTAADGGADTVVLRARIQRVARSHPSEFEWGTRQAVDTAWSSESSPVRVRYGSSAEVRLTDQDHRTWKVVLHQSTVGHELSVTLSDSTL